MVEWSITTVLKTVVLRGTGGSNPSLSATESYKSKDFQDFFIIILACPSKITFTTNSVVLYIFYIIS